MFLSLLFVYFFSSLNSGVFNPTVSRNQAVSRNPTVSRNQNNIMHNKSRNSKLQTRTLYTHSLLFRTLYIFQMDPCAVTCHWAAPPNNTDITSYDESLK